MYPSNNVFTATTNGMLIPMSIALSLNILAALTPSATMTISSRACSRVSPLPNFSPILRFLPWGEVAVTYKSPNPAGPNATSARAPNCGRSRHPSRNPALNIAALRLSPPKVPVFLRPSTRPQARATTF